MKLSIVTIVRNHREGLSRTIESVRAQSFTDYEYIAVDGSSTDGTIDLIQKNNELFSCVVYGADKGIYDAMNRGLEKAVGEYIIFMNAGDIFAHKDSLKCVFEAVKGSPDIIYGDHTVSYGYMSRYAKGSPLKDIWKGMLTSHQAFFVKTTLAQKNSFDCSIRLGADFDMIYRLYKQGCSFLYVPCEVAVTESGGVSDKKRVTVYKNHLDTLKAHGITAGQYTYYLLLLISESVKPLIKKILPQSLVRKITAIKAGK